MQSVRWLYVLKGFWWKVQAAKAGCAKGGPTVVDKLEPMTGIAKTLAA